MRYKGRIHGFMIGFIQSIAWWFIVKYLIGNPVHVNHAMIATAVYSVVGWIIGKQYDMVVYYSKQNEELLQFKEKMIRKVLNENEQRYQSLFVHNTDAILIFDLGQRLIDANPATEKIAGCTIEELKGYGYQAFVDEENTKIYQNHLKKAMTGNTQEYGITIHNQKREKLCVDVKAVPIVIEKEIHGIFVILKDRTKEKKINERLQQSEKLSMIGQLAAGVAHEIRNPLTTLKGFVQLLKTELNKVYVDIMLSELDRINQIVSEFLVLSKPHKQELKWVNVNEIVTKVIAMMETQANGENVQIVLQIEEQMPNVKCEANQLKQVFINLVKNAIEAMEDQGKIRIQTAIVDHRFIKIIIEDEGCGMPQDTLQRVGEPFYTTKESGTGLGLMVSQGIIQNHGGKLNIRSEPKKGTIVEVLLPINVETNDFTRENQQVS